VIAALLLGGGYVLYKRFWATSSTAAAAAPAPRVPSSPLNNPDLARAYAEQFLQSSPAKAIPRAVKVTSGR
jgi:hypothetical protein